MAGGRRTAKSSTFKHHAHASDDRACEVPTPQQALPPKHVPIPELPISSELGFDFDTFVFCLLAMSGQYMNLYRSVFWLPYSHTAYALNFYLIDHYVLSFNLMIVGRKLPLSLLKQVCFLFLPVSFHHGCMLCIKLGIITVLVPSILWCTYNIFMEHGALSIVFLGYPLVVYVILFGPTMTHVFELKCTAERCPVPKPKNSVNKNSPFNVGHICSMSPETVREEVEVLKTDFNLRLKHVLFNSLLLAYYLSFVPCCFAQTALYYELYWVGQHVVLTWLSCFTMHILYYFPSRYCDILHRAALHLGRWQRIDAKNMHVPHNMWTDSTMWNQGAHVKLAKEYFKAEGISNAAEPGNSTHSRFYTLFHNPSNPLSCLLILQIMLVLYLMYLLTSSYDWNQLFSVQFLMLMNCKTLYKVTRDVFVIKKVYEDEKALLVKFSS